MFTSPDNHQHKAPQAVLDHTTSSQNEEHAKSDLWNICENPERPTGNSEGIFLPTCNKWTHCSSYILAQQVRDYSWPVRPKICATGTLSWRRSGGGGGISHSWRYLYSSILSTNWPKSIFYTSKQRIFRTKSAFATRANLVTKVVEVVNFPCWVRKSRIRTEAHKKLLACSVSKGTGSQNLNKVIRENSCVYVLFFCIYLLFLWGSAWITTCVFLKQLI